jgi:hypothetical protein
MNLSFNTLKLISIAKIASFSFSIFFWDLNIKGLDFRIAIFFLVFLTLVDPSFMRSIKNINFFFGLLVVIFIAIHLYLNLTFDNQSIFFPPKEIIYMLATFFAVFFNLEFIRKNLKEILFFFIFCFIISTIINFLWIDYNILVNIYYRGISLSCSYIGGWHGYTSFFFNENSHFAMMSVPVVLYFILGFALNKLTLFKKFFILIFFFFK